MPLKLFCPDDSKDLLLFISDLQNKFIRYVDARDNLRFEQWQFFYNSDNCFCLMVSNKNALILLWRKVSFNH